MKKLPEGILAIVLRCYDDCIQAGDKHPEHGGTLWTRMPLRLFQEHGSGGFKWWIELLEASGFTAKKYDNGPLVCQMAYDQLVTEGVINLTKFPMQGKEHTL